MLLECLRAGAEKFLLRLVAVADPTAEENGGSAGHMGDAVGDAAAGARFGQSQRLFSRSQGADDDSFKLFIAFAKNVAPEETANVLLGLGDPVRRAVAPRGQAQVHFAGPRAIPEFEPGLQERTEGSGNFLLHHRFAEAGGLERPRKEQVPQRK